jgi:hypothetical protein
MGSHHDQISVVLLGKPVDLACLISVKQRTGDDGDVRIRGFDLGELTFQGASVKRFRRDGAEFRKTWQRRLDMNDQ